MDQRLSVITLGVLDLDRARRFYEDAFGWQAFMTEGICFFDIGGLIFGLWEREKLAKDAGLDAGGERSGFKDVALAYNTRSRAEVDEIVDRLSSKGVSVLKKPHETFWGGYSAYVADPDGHAWEIAWNEGWPVGEDGRLRLPDSPDR